MRSPRRVGLSLGPALGPEKGLRWAVAADNAEFLKRLDAFIAENHCGACVDYFDGLNG